MTELQYIDELLAELEDTAHGEISDRITIARKKLQELEKKENKTHLIIHARFTHELLTIAKKHENIDLNNIPEFMDILKAIEVLEKLYPELKNL